MSRTTARLIVFRVCVVAGVFVFVVFRPPQVWGYSHVGKAKNDVMHLELAVSAYKTKHSVWPDRLQILAERQPDGGGPFIEESLLLDPWGRPYHFDPRQLHPEAQVPLIWSDGQDPTNPDGRITNWPKPTSVWDVVLIVAPWASLVGAAGGLLGLAFILRRHGKRDAGDKQTSKKELAVEILVVLVCCGLLAFSCALWTPRPLLD
jgi:hypothetical protein